jgi:hypothetical protein
LWTVKHLLFIFTFLCGNIAGEQFLLEKSGSEVIIMIIIVRLQSLYDVFLMVKIIFMLMLRNFEIESGNCKVLEVCMNADCEHNHFRIAINEWLIRNTYNGFFTEISSNMCCIFINFIFLGLKITYDRTS